MTKFIESPIFDNWFKKHIPKKKLIICSPFMKQEAIDRVLKLYQIEQNCSNLGIKSTPNRLHNMQRKERWLSLDIFFYGKSQGGVRFIRAALSLFRAVYFPTAPFLITLIISQRKTYVDLFYKEIFSQKSQKNIFIPLTLVSFQ